MIQNLQQIGSSIIFKETMLQTTFPHSYDLISAQTWKKNYILCLIQDGGCRMSSQKLILQLNRIFAMFEGGQVMQETQNCDR